MCSVLNNSVGSRMNKVPMLRLSSFLVGIATMVATTAGATTMNDLFTVAERINAQAQESQAKIDALTEETRELYSDYKVVLKEIEGLRVYNDQLRKQIRNQEEEMAQISKSIDEVTVIERQITPLMIRMIDGLEQFVALDMPFFLQERQDRVERLREIMDRADVAVSEKFSQVLRAYQTENDFGRTVNAYTDTIEVNGTNLIVDVLQVGRVALLYQSSEGEQTGRYNAQTSRWEELDDSYIGSVRNGLKMARKQLTSGLFGVPVVAPE